MDETIHSLQTSAIQHATHGNWAEAIVANQSIIELEPNNISALNRLGLCYLQVGETEKAKKHYAKVIKLEPFNSIAKKHLEMIRSGKVVIRHPNTPSPETFIEEPGKTKTVQLCRPADSDVLRSLSVATPCQLVIKNTRIVVQTEDKQYIGCLPDDLSHTLRTLMHSGNSYHASIRSINKQGIEVFLRETERGEKAGQLISFPVNGKQSSTSSVNHAHLQEHLMLDNDPERRSSPDEESIFPEDDRQFD